MIVEDNAATTIVFDGNPATIRRYHRSSTVSDAFGTRSLTMVFSGDNRAWVKDAQGNEQVVPQHYRPGHGIPHPGIHAGQTPAHLGLYLLRRAGGGRG